MSEALWVTGDTLDVLRKMPDGCVDLVMTSPPFLALRSYLPADDPNKGREIGQEATPGAFLDVLLDITEECARVLAPHGSLVVELGDTYSGSGGAGGDYGEGGLREGQQTFKQNRGGRGGRASMVEKATGGHHMGGAGWPLAKSLALIPETFRWALAYGRNPHTGRETDPWRVRNVVRWCRPNPPVGALGDKFRPATSEMVVACKSGERWFDLDAVRVPYLHPEANDRNVARGAPIPAAKGPNPDRNDAGAHSFPLTTGGTPPYDWWEIPTSPYKGAHYASYPERLCVRPIKAMCPLEVCTVCGEPRRRITSEPVGEGGLHQAADGGGPTHGGHSRPDRTGSQMGTRDVKTLGWTDCGHGSYRPGRVLDIFAGSGTTLAVATGHARIGIGIDLDARNATLAEERIGPMFFNLCDVDELAARLT